MSSLSALLQERGSSQTKKEFCSNSETENESENSSDQSEKDSENEIEKIERDFLGGMEMEFITATEKSQKDYFDGFKALSMADSEVSSPPPKA